MSCPAHTDTNRCTNREVCRTLVTSRSVAFAPHRTTCIVGCPDSYVISGQSKHSLVEPLGGGGGVGGGLGGAGGGGGGDGGIAIDLTSDSVKLFKAAREQCLSVWFRECSNDMHWNK